MKRRLLILKVHERARALGKEWTHEREGKHEVWRCGRTRVTIPRHREVVEATAWRIFRELETELGENWWR